MLADADKTEMALRCCVDTVRIDVALGELKNPDTTIDSTPPLAISCHSMLTGTYAVLGPDPANVDVHRKVLRHMMAFAYNGVTLAWFAALLEADEKKAFTSRFVELETIDLKTATGVLHARLLLQAIGEQASAHSAALKAELKAHNLVAHWQDKTKELGWFNLRAAAEPKKDPPPPPGDSGIAAPVDLVCLTHACAQTHTQTHTHTQTPRDILDDASVLRRAAIVSRSCDSSVLRLGHLIARLFEIKPTALLEALRRLESLPADVRRRLPMLLAEGPVSVQLDDLQYRHCLVFRWIEGRVGMQAAAYQQLIQASCAVSRSLPRDCLAHVVCS